MSRGETTPPTSITLEACGRRVVCDAGGWAAEWEDGSFDLACAPDEPEYEVDMPTPVAGGSRRLRRFNVRHMRRGAVRQLLGGAVSDVQRDQQFIDLTLTDVSVAEVIALLEQQ
jgi:hypothetical protein